ncbi:MAG: anhydro-N-acetylmuramic acid kinase [Tepidisphaeraceae bacterium]
MSDQSRLFAGAMSGTSADGVDVACVRIAGRGLEMSAKLVAHHFVAYDANLRGRIFTVREDGAARFSELAGIRREISLTYSAALRAVLSNANLRADELTALAAHGQTLFHDPPATIQLLDPSLLAIETGCTVVSDFRTADCAVRGQGAPLVPFADWVLFRSPARSRLLINLGGISNITWLARGGSIEQVIAFDTGPGNCISDELMRELHPEGGGYDAGGNLAGHGRADEAMVRRILAHDYFRRPPPKSTDGPAMIGLFRDQMPDPGGRSRLPDRLATACLLSAGAIGRGVRDFVPDFPDEVFVSGGGALNATLMRMLTEQLGGIRLQPIDELGIPSGAKEAVAFALLGAATIDGVASNVPSATGASRSVVLGSITPRPL